MFMCSFILIIFFGGSVFGANILFISLVASPSHHIWNEALTAGLLEKGHNITLIGHDDARISTKNYTVLKIAGLEELYEEIHINELMYGKNSQLDDLIILWDYISIFAKLDLNSDALKLLLSYPRDMFDLIIYDIVGGQCFYPLIEYFGNPPVIGVSPFALPPYILDTMGSPFYFYQPMYVLPYSDKMTFSQKLENVMYYMVEYFLKWYRLPKIFKMTQERFGKNIVPFDQVERQIVLLLANYHPVLDFPLPLPPHIIPVGGLHTKRPTILSADVQNILDEANQGVIYFSFGTNLHPSSLAMEKKRVFLSAFSKLNETVLWKYDGDDLQNLPSNVIIRKWYSQNNILAHKNTKLFMSHSGGLSTQEAMYHGVPVVGIPIVMDQKSNAQKIEIRKLGKRLQLKTITVDGLYNAIQEVINNPLYKENMLRISQTFRDQPETSLERAVFWVEYTLKHKNLSHLSISARDMSMYQRENMDIWGFMLVSIVIFSISSYALIKWIAGLLTYKKSDKIKRN